MVFGDFFFFFFLLYHMPPLTRRNPRRNDTPHRSFHLYNPFLGKNRFLFHHIFWRSELSLGDIILYLGELGPPLGKIGLTGGICLSRVFSLGEVKLSTIFSLEEKNLPFGGVDLPLREKALYLEEHSLNLPASFSHEAINLPHEWVDLSTNFSLGGTNSSSKEFVLPLVKVSFPCRISYVALFSVVSPSLNFFLIKDP